MIQLTLKMTLGKALTDVNGYSGKNASASMQHPY
jgi:hypothetical protein